jgi:hypothetical protein
MTMTDHTAPQPDFTSPIAGRIEVREPCPWCAGRPMIPRSLMDEHVARLHPEVQTVDAVAPAVQAPAADRAAGLDSVRPHTLASIAGHLDARAVAIMRPDSQTFAEWQTVATVLRRMADEAQPTEAVPCMRSEPHPAHTHSGLRKGVAVHGRCPGGEPAAGAQP